MIQTDNTVHLALWFGAIVMGGGIIAHLIVWVIWTITVMKLAFDHGVIGKKKVMYPPGLSRAPIISGLIFPITIPLVLEALRYNRNKLRMLRQNLPEQRTG